MLEVCAHQAAGLQAVALQANARMLAIASHGQQRGELSLLWDLCATLAELGYAVLVLDATHAESEQQAGLAQMLDGQGWPEEELNPTLPWSILPSATGLARLQRFPAERQKLLRALTTRSMRFGVVILYASAEVLASVLPDSGVAPALVVSADKKSLVSAYQAIKHLLLNGGLRPSIACMVASAEAPPLPPDSALDKNLRDCAMSFLGYQLDCVKLDAVNTRQGRESPLRALALRLVESALPLHADSWPLTRPASQAGSHFAGGQ